MKVTGKLEGADSLMKNLAKLESKVQGKILISAARSAMNTIARKAKSLVPEDSGLLKRAIKSKVKVYKGGSVLFAVVGIDTRMGEKTESGKWRLANFYAKKVEMQNPYMRPAWESEKNKIQPAFEKVIDKQIKKELSK